MNPVRENISSTCCMSSWKCVAWGEEDDGIDVRLLSFSRADEEWCKHTAVVRLALCYFIVMMREPQIRAP